MRKALIAEMAADPEVQRHGAEYKRLADKGSEEQRIESKRKLIAAMERVMQRKAVSRGDAGNQ